MTSINNYILKTSFLVWQWLISFINCDGYGEVVMSSTCTINHDLLLFTFRFFPLSKWYRTWYQLALKTIWNKFNKLTLYLQINSLIIYYFRASPKLIFYNKRDTSLHYNASINSVIVFLSGEKLINLAKSQMWHWEVQQIASF